MTMQPPSTTDGDSLRQVVEELVEEALRTTSRRPTSMEVRHLSNRLYEGLKDYIDRQIERTRWRPSV